MFIKFLLVLRIYPANRVIGVNIPFQTPNIDIIESLGEIDMKTHFSWRVFLILAYRVIFIQILPKIYCSNIFVKLVILFVDCKINLQRKKCVFSLFRRSVNECRESGFIFVEA